MFGLETIKKIKVIKRFNHIVLVFLRGGFGYYISQVGFTRYIPFYKRIGSKRAKPETLPRRLRVTLEKLGPVFVKFGQILSTRSDLLPKEFINELAQLQAKVPPFPFPEAQKTIEKNLGKSLHAIFKKFDAEPFASASLGQVYKATLFTGEAVAVKVQRPRVKEHIELDTEVLLMAAHLMEKYFPDLKQYNIIETVHEFRRWTLNEIDYRKEATNCEVFSNFFQDDKKVYGPKVFWEYSAASVLTLEFVDGASLRDVVTGKAKIKVNKKQLANVLADSFVKQCFDYGFFHADPHPGNIFVLENGELMFLDFGMVGLLDKSLTTIATNIFLALMQRDTEALIKYFLQIEQNYDENLGELDSRQKVRVNGLRKSLNELLIRWPKNNQAGRFTMLFYELLNTAVGNGIGLPVDLVMLGKTIMTLVIVIKDLDPEFQMEKFEEPLLENIINSRFGEENVKSKLQSNALIVDDLVKRLPESTAKIVENLERSRFGMEMNTQQLLEYETLLNKQTHRNNRVFLLGAIVIVSALTYPIAGQPHIWHWTLSQIGLIGGIILIVILLLSE